MLSARAPAWVVEVGLALGLFLGALAIRLPYLMLMPSFSDETVEVLRSLKISQGALFPLTNADPYYGAIYNYLVAGVLYIFGPTAENARLMVTVLGALTVPLAYFFAKVAQDRLTGLVVALMMLTSGALVFNGHIAWENELTPFFATATLLVFVFALKRGSGKLLVAAGLLYGLTLQTHPGIVILAPGLALYFIYAGLRPHAAGAQRSLRSWLKSPWPYLTLAAALIGYGNVIAQSILQPGIEWTVAQKHDYAYVAQPTLETYLTNLQNFSVMALRMASSSFENRPTPGEYLLIPINVLYLAVLAVGVGYAVKSGRILPVIVLLMTGSILPYFNKSYGYPGAARYVGYLFPLLYLLIATPLVRAVRQVHISQGLRAVYFWLIVLFLIVAPVLALAGFYRATLNSGATNERVLIVYQSLRQQYRTGDISEVIIEKGLNKLTLGGGGNVERALDYLLTLDNTSHRTLDMTPAAVKAEQRKDPSRALAVVIAADGYKSLSAQVQLSALGDEPGDGSPGKAKYGAYIIGGQAH